MLWAYLSWALSIGSFRIRLPVAAKIALATAGITADVPGSPTPPGASTFSAIRRTVELAGKGNPLERGLIEAVITGRSPLDAGARVPYPSR